jgi:hypothetical protein
MTLGDKMPLSGIFRKLSFSGELKIGDILTITTILISLGSVLISWDVDRRIRLTKEANDIRIAAATTLGDLERWKGLSLSLFAECQGSFVEASEIASSSAQDSPEARNKRLQRARDLLWKKINEAHNNILRKIVEEKLENGYMTTFVYFPNIRLLYQQSLQRMQKSDADMVNEILSTSEINMLSFAETGADLQTAPVGNALRRTAVEVRAKYQNRLAEDLSEAQKFLIGKIEGSDGDLLNAHQR